MSAKQIQDAILRELQERPKLLRELAKVISATGAQIAQRLVKLKQNGRVKSCFFLGETNPYWTRTAPLMGSSATPCHFCHQPCGEVTYVHTDPPTERYATCGDCMRGLGQLSLLHVEGGKPVLSLEMQLAIKEALSPSHPPR